MYRAFKLNNCQFPEELIEAGLPIFDNTSQKVRLGLDQFLSGGTIDGSSLRDHWFTEIKADVFISHSHKDQNNAIALAALLEIGLGLKAFVDSCVWGYSEDLLWGLDSKYCLNESGDTFNYQTRNVTTGHVHMMLATALSRMIDTTECVIFVSSPNSVSHSRDSDPKVNSPWIFYELSQIATIQKKVPQREFFLAENQRAEFSKKAAAQLNIHYQPDFSALECIDEGTLTEWIDRWKKKDARYSHALDTLYEIATL